MNGRDFYELYAQKYGFTIKQSEEFCRMFIELLDECLKNLQPDERLKFYGFGTFLKKRTSDRTIGDLQTGNRIVIPAKDKIVFYKSK